jgi:SAM-dependent methyltransferase
MVSSRMNRVKQTPTWWVEAWDVLNQRLFDYERQSLDLHQRYLSNGPCRVIELGCGTGHYLYHLAAFGHTCIGIELDPDIADGARHRCSPKVDIRQGDFNDVAEDLHASFDLVLMRHLSFPIDRWS